MPKSNHGITFYGVAKAVLFGSSAVVSGATRFAEVMSNEAVWGAVSAVSFILPALYTPGTL